MFTSVQQSRKMKIEATADVNAKTPRRHDADPG
jgi:hypothetical protein